MVSGENMCQYNWLIGHTRDDNLDCLHLSRDHGTMQCVS